MKSVVVVEPLNKLKDYRILTGMSVERLSKITGISHTTISRAEKGYSSILLETLKIIKNALGCEWSDILDD